MSPTGRYCCKSLFALVIKNSPGFRRDLRVKMWGTSSPTDKLTGDLGNVIEATQTGVRRSDRLPARKLSPGNFGLLQHNLPTADIVPHRLYAAEASPLKAAKGTSVIPVLNQYKCIGCSPGKRPDTLE